MLVLSGGIDMDLRDSLLLLSLIVAALSLIRPELQNLWSRKFRPPRIDIYRSGNIEVGYGPYGPTIGLRGTLAAVHGDQFVRNIDVLLVRHEDRARHELVWRLFRSGRIVFAPGQPEPAELPSGFMLLTTQPYRYNILFNDTAVESAMQPHWQAVGEAWSHIRQDLDAQPTIDGQRVFAIGGGDPATSANYWDQHWEAKYEEFARGELHTKAAQTLDRLCYLNPGRYRITLRVSTDRPDRTYSRSWSIALAEGDSENIRRNGSSILREVCGRSAYYQGAYVDYQPDQLLEGDKSKGGVGEAQVMNEA